MILVFGGTTEGRKAVDTIDKAGKTFFYSTRSDMQKVQSHYGIRITGALDYEKMSAFCKSHDIRLIIDAAHPFASQLHATIAEVGKDSALPVIRYDRRYPERDRSFVWCDDMDDAIEKLKGNGINRLLALTGVQTISKLKDFWINHECIFRILNRQESLDKAAEAGFPLDRIVFYETDEHISPLIDRYHPEAIITKESGESGGYAEKVAEAKARGVSVFVIRRPEMPESFITVTGEYGLRKEIERLLPGFFELRSGFTTGACATAAAKAALLALIEEDEPQIVGISIPNGEELFLPIKEISVSNRTTASAIVVKDAGDDPDVTNGCEINVTVELTTDGHIRFIGGEGIGTVTLPGIGLDIGEPAINPIPRKMITEELSKIYPSGCNVTISVPGGAELAQRTFNPRIGIVGGISIIGTSGVVMPFSNEAFIEAIRREMEVGIAVAGNEHIVVNAGARSERFVRSVYPELPQPAFIHYGNAIGETLKIADELHVKRLSVGLMLGKAVKLAEGNMDTHSHKVTMNKDFLVNVASTAGCTPEVINILPQINMARELWTNMQKNDADLFFPNLLNLCKEHCLRIFSHGQLELLLITDTGEIAYRIN